MKWIKSRQTFLSEAKIGEVILPRQAKEIGSVWGESYLELEEVTPTEHIKQGTWKISEEDKESTLETFFSFWGMELVLASFQNLPKKFLDTLKIAFDVDSLDKSEAKIFNEFDPASPTLTQLSLFGKAIFFQISTETLYDTIVDRDEMGRPKRDEMGNIKHRNRQPDEITFYKNKVNFKDFVEGYNRIFTGEKVSINNRASDLIFKLAEDFSSGNRYKVDFDYRDDLYLSILHNPQDILNMSISTFFASCQHLYSGLYREKLLSNVFDPNTIPAFLHFNADVYDTNGNLISKKLPLSRVLIRYVEKPDGKTYIFFDKTYPNRLESLMTEFIERYSGNLESAEYVGSYIFAPDVPMDAELPQPYMDKLGIVGGYTIGKNVKILNFSQGCADKVLVMKGKQKFEGIRISTSSLPANFRELELESDWLTVEFMTVFHTGIFEKMKTKELTFQKCTLDYGFGNDDEFSALEDLNKWLKSNSTKTLNLISCKFSKEGQELQKIDFSDYNVEVLGIQYPTDFDVKNLETILENKMIKKVELSRDMINEEVKSIIAKLKAKGKKVEIKGPKVWD